MRNFPYSVCRPRITAENYGALLVTDNISESWNQVIDENRSHAETIRLKRYLVLDWLHTQERRHVP